MAEPTSILGRRDVPLAACISVSGVAALGAVSALLEPGRQVDDASEVAILGLIVSVVTAGLALAIERPLPTRWRGRLRTSLVPAAFLIAALSAVAVDTNGLSNVFFTGVILVATYMGLVVPRRWSRAAIALLLVVETAIQVITPAPRIIDAFTMFAVTVAGWLLGMLGNRAHHRAARVALVLSRTDPLSVTLNRRGFFEEFESGLAEADAEGRPYSLLVFDLDGFSDVNARYGSDEGDDLLRWVGQRLADVLPADASAGRLGIDEFGIALPGLDQAAADVIGVKVASALAVRTGASLGCATYLPSLGIPRDADDLVRIADAELSAVKRGLDVHHPVLETTSRRTSATTRDARRTATPPPPLRYRELIASGGVPARPADGVEFDWLSRSAGLVLGIAGGLIGAVQVAQGGDTIYDQILRFTLGPWIVAAVLVGVLEGRRTRAELPRAPVSSWAMSVLLGTGVGGVLLAGDGIQGAVVTGLYLKVMFDAFVLPRRRAIGTLITMLCWWAGIIALGPADALWAAPFQLAMFLASFAVSATANRAYTDVSRRSRSFAHADALTGLGNRSGFEADLADAPRRALEAGRVLAIVLFDVDDLRAYNDTHGHAAGDALLIAVAEATRIALPTAYALARIGGDEFIAAVPIPSAADAPRLEEELCAALKPIIGVSIGSAVMPVDGSDIGTLIGTADRRSYARKAATTAPND